MNKLRHKVLSILLIPTLLFSTTSFNIEKHECGGHIFSISLMGNAESCEMEMESCDKQSELICSSFELGYPQDVSFPTKNSCCNDINIFVEGSIVQLENQLELSKLQVIFLTTFTYTYNDLFKIVEETSKHFKNYAPPLLSKDLSVLFQVFII